MSSINITQTIENYFNIDLSVKNRKRQYVYPKSILCYLLRENSTHSLRQTKLITGYKSNRSIVYHVQSVEANLKINKAMQKDVAEIKKLLGL